MHELSIASAIVAEVRDAMRANDVATVADVTVKVGRLSGIVAEALEFGWDIVRQGTELAGAALIVEDDPVVVWCPDGDHALELSDDAVGGLVFRCAEHECVTPEVLSGERLEIVRFTIGRPAAAAETIANPGGTTR